jgi:Ca-activated chloride channel family protein
MLRSAEIRRRRLRGLTSAATLTGALTAATTLAVRGSAQTPTFSTKTEAIHVTATVIDQDGRLATGLSKDDFEIRENGVPREITIFRSDTVPFAIAIMLDVSGSMVLNLGLMRRGMEQLISRFEPGDRATVGTFQGLPMINPRFTANPQRLMEGVAGAMGGMGAPCTGQWHPESVAGSVGGSAVWAAIECGIEQVAADSETPRRVVMVVTDAMDNASKRVGPSDLKKLADDYGIMIYGVGMRGSEGLNSPTLRELAEKSGGGYFQLKDFSELVPTFGRVADELRHQYIFGFTPASSDDRKRTIEVRSLRPGTTARWRRVYLQAAPVHTRPAASLSAATPTPPEPRPVNPPAGATPSVSRGAVLDALDRYERG